MAIPTEPTLSTRIRMISRSSGHSAAKLSAYISGTKIEPSDELKAKLQDALREQAKQIDLNAPGLDEAGRAELTEKRARLSSRAERPVGAFDYSARQWNVELAELVTPAGSPEWAKDRETLWNRVEAKERGLNAQVAREFRCNLSYDLTAEQRRAIAHRVAKHFTDLDMCVDLAVHRYGQRFAVGNPKTAEQVAKWKSWGVPFVSASEAVKLNSEHVREQIGKDGKVVAYALFQPHLHALMPTRPIAASGDDFESKSTQREALGKGPDGKYQYRVIGESRARQWNNQEIYEKLRGRIARRQNAMLRVNGSPRRIHADGYEVRREKELDRAAKSTTAGKVEKAAQHQIRAAQLLRDPQPYLGVVRRVKEMSSEVRQTMSQWVARRHQKRLEPLIDALWERDQVAFVAQAQRLLEATRRSLGLDPPALQPAAIGPTDPELEL